MNENNIVKLFVDAAQTHSHAIAFIEGKEKLTYQELLQKVQTTAAFFSKKGIRQEDKVLVFIPMQSRLYVAVLALFYIGACPVFIDEWVSLSRLKECLKVVPCQAIVATRKLLFLTPFIKSLRDIKIKIAPSGVTSEVITSKPVSTAFEDTALITFTTGSTGVPKAANRTHQFLAAQQAALEPLLSGNFVASLTLLPIVVLMHLSLGKTVLLPLRKGATNKPSYINHLLQLLQQHSVESVIASPAIIIAIAKRSLRQKTQTNSIKHIITGGGPLFPDEAGVIEKAFPQAHTTVVYGSTEAEPISHITIKEVAATPDEMLKVKGLPVGLPHPAIKVVIIPYTDKPIAPLSADEWKSKTVPLGTTGEIAVSGEHVLKEYINNDPAQKRNKIVVENTVWHRTGDEGRLDNNGALAFLGRCGEVIKWKEKIIYPLISVWLLKQMIPLQEAAVLIMNNELVLVLEKNDKPLQKQTMAVAQKAGLEDVVIIFVSKIPKDKRHHTKIDYDRLKKWLH
jgi:acyl-CoA synthetase (AMP-forming)/AMP-acid ligase II